MRPKRAQTKSPKSVPKSIYEVIQAIDLRAPQGAAESWDNVGLLVGDPKWKTRGAVVCVDLTAQAIRAAQARGYRLIINHHPCIFPKSKGITRVLADSGKTGLVFDAIQKGIAVACYHTNFDRCAIEVVHTISTRLGITPRGRLHDKSEGALTKLVVFVPLSHRDQVRAALAEAGAGHIGNYDSCSFVTQGEGSFRGAQGTRPFLGKPGRLEKAQEVRIETVFATGVKELILRALRKAHPYEEIAYDLIPLAQGPSSDGGGEGLVKGLGYGFWGEYDRSKSYAEVIKSVKRTFGISGGANGFLVTHPEPKKVRRLAFAAGNGGSFVEAAAKLGCDLMITGEVDYHQALAVSAYRKTAPMGVLTLGHRESEKFYVSTVRQWLTDAGMKSLGLHVQTQKFRV